MTDNTLVDPAPISPNGPLEERLWRLEAEVASLLAEGLDVAAIAGVLGAYLVIYPRAKVWSLVPFLFFIPLRLPAWLVLGGWFVLQWAYSAGYAASGAGSVAYLAHVFGFLAGVVVGLIVRATSPPPQYPVHPRLGQV